MFNLDQAISEWRRLMAEGGMRTPEFLDELESHLGDDVEEQMRHGLTPEQAFTAASSRLGKPAALQHEFKKGHNMNRTPRTALSLLQMRIWAPHLSPDRIKFAMMTLAGVPNHSVDRSANQPAPTLEPGWATYFRAVVLMGPALLIWAAAEVILRPKLREVCLKAEFDVPAIIRFFFHVMDLPVNNLWIFVGTTIGVFALLEWRSSRWPRYRRATMGFGAFLVNAAVLISITLIGALALIAASKLMIFAKSAF